MFKKIWFENSKIQSGWMSFGFRMWYGSIIKKKFQKFYIGEIEYCQSEIFDWSEKINILIFRIGIGSHFWRYEMIQSVNTQTITLPWYGRCIVYDFLIFYYLFSIGGILPPKSLHNENCAEFLKWSNVKNNIGNILHVR